MIWLGIVLLLIGALVAYLAAGDVANFGRITAGIGLILIVLGAIFALADAGGDAAGETELDGVLLLPALYALKDRLRLTPKSG
jgi:hypothetical protein